MALVEEKNQMENIASHRGLGLKKMFELTYFRQRSRMAEKEAGRTETEQEGKWQKLW